MKRPSRSIAGAAIMGAVISASGSVNADSGFYIGANVGYGDQENKIVRESQSTESLSLKAGYDFSDYIGVEVRYGGVGSRSSEIDLDNFTSLYAKPQYLFTESLSIYGLAGVSRTPVTLYNGSADEKETLNSFSYGLGLGWMLGDHARLIGEYARISSDDDFTLDAFSLGFDWRF
ncbi:MAG: porin family protein [Halioglobus sp.]